MTKNFLFVRQGESYEKAEQKAIDLKIDAFPVLDSDNKFDFTKAAIISPEQSVRLKRATPKISIIV